jgi:predicted RNase H-like HicB family nuclease
MKLCVKVRRNVMGGYTATCPSLPGCVAAGTTQENAVERLDEAIRGYLAGLEDFVPERVQKVLELVGSEA